MSELIEVGRAVVEAWDAMLIAAADDYGAQGPLYPNDTMALADAIAAFRAVLNASTT